MNFIKRGFASITRRKGKSLILFLVVFVLGNVIAGSIAIRQGTENVEKNIKKQLGATATINMDYELMTDEEVNTKEVKNYTLEQVKTIGESPYVKYYDYSASFYPSTQKKVVAYEEPIDENATLVYGGESVVTLKGTANAEFLDLKEKKIVLKEGRTFSQDEIDKGEAVLIVSKKLADANNWHLGDKIIYDVNQYEYDEEEKQKPDPIYNAEYPFTIIGIFENTAYSGSSSEKKLNQDQKAQKRFNQELAANTAYTSNKMILEMTEAEAAGTSQEVTQEVLYNPVYVLKTPEDTAAFKEEAQTLLGNPWVISASTDQYESMAGSIKGMAKISQYVIMISVVASLFIITLVILLFLRDRKHELGIYLSLGEKRGKVIGQIVLEVFVIAFMAITLSVFTGNLLAKGVSGTLMSSELLAGKQDEGNSMALTTNVLDEALTTQDIQDAYEVKLSASYIIIFYVIGLSTILLSTIVPLIYILRLNPKKIMM